MKRFSRPIIALNVLLLMLVVYLLFANSMSHSRDRSSSVLIQQAYQGDPDFIGMPRIMDADPNVYFDAATRQPIPSSGWLREWIAKVRGQKPDVRPNSAPVISLAITYGRAYVVDHILALGADVNAPDDKGSTPLHYAALHNQRDILITLLDHHADVNHVNSAGQTALHIAVAQHNVVNAQILLDRGANPNIADKAGQTPLDNIGFEAEDQHREWMLRYGENKLAPAKDLKETPLTITASYKRRLDSLRPLIIALQRSGAKMSKDTQNRLAGSFDLNPREVDQALAAPEAAKPGKVK